MFEIDPLLVDMVEPVPVAPQQNELVRLDEIFGLTEFSGAEEFSALSKSAAPPHRELGAMVEFTMSNGKKARVHKERWAACATPAAKEALFRDLRQAVGL